MKIPNAKHEKKAMKTSKKFLLSSVYRRMLNLSGLEKESLFNILLYTINSLNFTCHD